MSRLSAERGVPAADGERAATLEASMLMDIMPILSRRRSAGIRHNIAQFCQALLFPSVIRLGGGHIVISLASPVIRGRAGREKARQTTFEMSRSEIEKRLD